MERLCALENIRKISVRIYETYDGTERRNVDFAALDKENNLITCVENVLEIREKTTCTDIAVRSFFVNDTIKTKVFTVDNKGVMSILDSDKTIMEDVVHISRDHIVTRSGSIYYDYCWESKNPKSTEGKTKVKDIWLEGNG